MKVRKKSPVFEAYQFIYGENELRTGEFLGLKIIIEDDAYVMVPAFDLSPNYTVTFRCNVGDYILISADGKKRVLKKELFDREFEVVLE